MEATRLKSNTIQEMQDTIEGVMDKYTFIESYMNQPNIRTGKRIPMFIKFMSTILYLRQKLDFLVEPTESFYNDIDNNDYSDFENLDITEIHKILITFVTFTCTYIEDKVEEEEERTKIINRIRSYYYKNKDFAVSG